MLLLLLLLMASTCIAAAAASAASRRRRQLKHRGTPCIAHISESSSGAGESCFCVSVAIVLDLSGDILMSIGFSSSACVGDAVGASAAGTAGVEVAGSVGASTVDTVGVGVGIIADCAGSGAVVAAAAGDVGAEAAGTVFAVLPSFSRDFLTDCSAAPLSLRFCPEDVSVVGVSTADGCSSGVALTTDLIAACASRAIF